MIVVSASGMATGGRVLHHLAARISDHRNTVVLVGFQAPGTRGWRLTQGERMIKMFGRYSPVEAEVAYLPLSAHADRDGLLGWLGTTDPAPEMVYVVHGEEDASSALVDGIGQRLGWLAVAPRDGERVRL